MNSVENDAKKTISSENLELSRSCRTRNHNWPLSQEKPTFLHANNKYADQPACRRRLISAFVFVLWLARKLYLPPPNLSILAGFCS